VGKDRGICLWSLDRDQITRRSSHCDASWNTQFSLKNPVGNSIFRL
jgi:hypothetical protein